MPATRGVAVKSPSAAAAADRSASNSIDSHIFSVQRGAGCQLDGTRPRQKRGGINYRNAYNRSTERRAEAAGDARAHVGLRRRARDVHAAVDEPVDERANDLRAVE